MLLTLVRHGETEWNRTRRIQGSTDVPLNDTGRAQALASGRLLARRTWDAVYTSPLVRARETASLIARELNLGEPTPIPAIVERAYGQAEGLGEVELAERFPPGTPVPGREPREKVVARVLPALVDIAERHPGDAVVVVSHGGVIRSVLGAVDPRGAHGTIVNGSLHTFWYGSGTWRLIAFDDPLDELSEALGEDIDAQNALERRENASVAVVTDARAAAYVERLAERGVTIEARVMAESTHTAQQAASAIGCDVTAIVKSLLFRAGEGFVLVLASGPNRVDTAQISALVGEHVTMADASTVKAVTGYSIGGVPPLAHATALPTIVDETLLTLETVWAAAGSATSVFAIDPRRLVELSAATIARVS